MYESPVISLLPIANFLILVTYPNILRIPFSLLSPLSLPHTHSLYLIQSHYQNILLFTSIRILPYPFSMLYSNDRPIMLFSISLAFCLLLWVLSSNAMELSFTNFIVEFQVLVSINFTIPIRYFLHRD